MSIERGFRPPDAETWHPQNVKQEDRSGEKEPERVEWPPIEKPDPEVVKRRRKSLIVKTMVALIHIGHIGYLDDVAEALHGLHKISPDEAELVDEVKVEIQQLLPRLRRHTLLRLNESQPTDPEENADIAAARLVLRSAGFGEGETKDADVSQILDYRHLLLELKE